MVVHDVVGAALETALQDVRRGVQARDVESQLVEFKTFKRPAPNDRDPVKAGALDLAEAIACMANARGGAVVVGVGDDGAGAAAFVGVPDGLGADDLRHRIWELTSPPLVVAAEERTIEGAAVIVLRIDPGFDLHRVGGKLRERVGDTCIPMTSEREARVRDERRNYDWSEVGTALTIDAVVETAVEEARRLLSQAGDDQSRRRATLSRDDLLRECGVLGDDGRLSRAGALLFTGAPVAPHAALQYLRKRTPGGALTRPPAVGTTPLLLALRECLREIDAVNETTPVTLASGVQQHLETVPRAAVREAVVNALTHRDYRLPEQVVVEHSPTQLVVTSPGELVVGVTEDNLLTHTSKPRNRKLAEALRVLRLAEQAGTGVDVMVRSMVRAGHSPPVFSSRDGFVRAVLTGGAPVARVAALITELPEEVREDTDAALIINHLRAHTTVNAVDLAPILQKSQEEAAEALRRLSHDRYDLIESTRETRRYRLPAYRFRERVRADLGSLLPYHRNDQDEVDRRIVAHLREYSTISNQSVQNLCQVKVGRASALLRSLADRGVIKKTDESPERGPTVRYERGPAFPPVKARRR